MKKGDVESGHADRGDNGSPLRELSEIIEAMVETLEPPLSPKCCIYRVPKKLRELNEAAYTPHLVSIGPFHNGKEGLQTMEKHKVRNIEKIRQLLPPGVRLEDLLSYIKGCEAKVRSYYAEAIVLKGDDFLKMVLLDGCFIIKLFLSCVKGFEDENDKILMEFLFRNGIIGDLFLLENQLPFFLLEGLYNIAFPTASNSFLKLSCRFFTAFNWQNKPMEKAEEVKHFTDLLRTFILPTLTEEKVKEYMDFLRTYFLSTSAEERVKEAEERLQPTRHSPKSAAELQEAGVKFKVKSSKCLFDIQFRNGELEIPFLRFEDGTESYFRNIVALEQCHPYSEIDSFSNYILLMDSLIDTSKDVDLLVREKIIENWLGDNDQVVTLVNRLSKEIIVPFSFYYHTLGEELNEYCKKRWHRWMATCWRDYLSTPWRIASTIAAFVLLLTLIQTVASIISLFE